jgi:hypothetical protein
MASDDIERTRVLARNLVELLSSYEEELIMLERTTPAVDQLRRAVGMAVAEACYLISDETAGDLVPPGDGTRAPRHQ